MAEEVPAEEATTAPPNENSKDTLVITSPPATATNNSDTNNSNNATPSWDHSSRKIMIQNMFKYHDTKQCRKMVSQWIADCNQAITPSTSASSDDGTASTSAAKIRIPIAVEKIKKPPKENWMTVTVTHPEMAQPLIEYINSHNILNKHGKPIFAKLAEEEKAAAALERKRPRKENEQAENDDDANNGDSSDRANANKRQRSSEQVPSSSTVFAQARRPVTADEVRNATTPLWKLSLPEQHSHKMKLLINKCAVKIVKEIKARYQYVRNGMNICKKNTTILPSLTPFALYFRAAAAAAAAASSSSSCGRTLSKEKTRKKKATLYRWLRDEKPIQVQDIIPVPTSIRNKCEFTFGYRYEYDDDDNNNNNIDDDSQKAKNDKQLSNNAAAKAAVDNSGDTTTCDQPNEGESTFQLNQSTDQETRPIKRVPAVGFMVTGWAGGVSRPHGCANVSSEACAIVDVVDQFLATSPLPPYDTKTHQGVWKFLTIRTSRRTRECMVIVSHSSAQGATGEGSVNEEETPEYEKHFASEKARLLSLLQAVELPVPDEEPYKVTSMFFQEYDGVSNPTPDHPVQHVYGKTSLSEKLGNCTFQISPGAFFQVNTVGAELLYNKVVEKVREVSEGDPKKTLLFDVCCGTGTIGLCCMEQGVVGRVVGVDISAPAIEDAKKNAELNGFSIVNQGVEEDVQPDAAADDDGKVEDQPVRFVAARAEAVLSKEIGKARARGLDLQFVAVVDPAREGLHTDVIKTLRSAKGIHRIVYVSCNPTGSLVRDAGFLCAPATKRYSGRPFKVTSACPVDMFPLTDHCEMVTTFDRLTEEEEANED